MCARGYKTRIEHQQASRRRTAGRLLVVDCGIGRPATVYLLTTDREYNVGAAAGRVRPGGHVSLPVGQPGPRLYRFPGPAWNFDNFPSPMNTAGCVYITSTAAGRVRPGGHVSLPLGPPGPRLYSCPEQASNFDNFPSSINTTGRVYIIGAAAGRVRPVGHVSLPWGLPGPRLYSCPGAGLEF
jgi:hypothetical protein